MDEEVRSVVDPAPRPIVVGVDWSDEATAAVGYAARLAARKAVPLRVVHAREPERYEAWSTVGWAPDVGAVTTDTAQALIERTVTDLRAEWPQLRLEGAVVDGPSIKVLVNESKRADTVVVGSRRMSGVAALLLGSTPLEICCRAACPMIAVPSGYDPSVERSGVVVGVDGSPMSRSTLAYAFDQAMTYGDHVTVVHTWTAPPVGDPSVAMTPMYSAADVEDEERQLMRECLSEWLDRFPQVRVEQHLQQSRPVTELLERSADARMLVVGSHGKGILHALFGAVNRGVLHGSRVPVAIIHS